MKKIKKYFTETLNSVGVFLWAMFICLLLSLFFMSGCKTTKTAAMYQSVDMHTKLHEDTMHYVITNTFSDTTHYEKTETEKTKIVEYFDPTTGLLSKRITECEALTNEMYNAYMSLKHENDSLKASRNREKDLDSDTEIKTKETRSVPWMKLSFAFVSFILFIAAILYIIHKIRK